MITVTGQEEHYYANAGAFAQLIQSNDPKRFAARYPYEVSPVTDNAPFFFFTLKARPDSASQDTAASHRLEGQSGRGRAGDGARDLAAGGAGIFGSSLALGGRGRQRARCGCFYFIAVGLGYILVEIAFIQRFVLSWAIRFMP